MKESELLRKWAFIASNVLTFWNLIWVAITTKKVPFYSHFDPRPPPWLMSKILLVSSSACLRRLPHPLCHTLSDRCTGSETQILSRQPKFQAFLLSALLRYNVHVIKFTRWKSTIQWFFVCLQSCAAITIIQLENIFTNYTKKKSPSWRFAVTLSCHSIPYNHSGMCGSLRGGLGKLQRSGTRQATNRCWWGSSQHSKNPYPLGEEGIPFQEWPEEVMALSWAIQTSKHFPFVSHITGTWNFLLWLCSDRGKGAWSRGEANL